ncbi:MAG TPA: hypothetical protein VMV69_00385 [Pirellulales bacterium]|nr:hypothetical protein [Pirellulales bacterium]
MARTTEGVSRSQAIRDYMRAHSVTDAQQVVDGLKEQGVIVTPGLVYQVKTAGRKQRAAKRAKKKEATATAAISSNGAGSTKADAIREIAKGMAKPVRPMDVRAALAAKGIEATSGQISSVLKGMGMRRRRRKGAAGRSTSAARATSVSISIDDLVAAKKLVGQVGSIEKVKEALAALARLT